MLVTATLGAETQQIKHAWLSVDKRTSTRIIVDKQTHTGTGKSKQTSKEINIMEKTVRHAYR